MSGPLLLGVAAFGVGWMYVTRDVKKASVPDTSAASNTAAAASDAAVVSSEIPPGAAATIVAADSSAPTIGEIPVAGSDFRANVVPKDSIVEGDIVIGDSDKSTGGSDPSTQRTAMNRTSDIDVSPPPISGDSQSDIIAARYGIEGSEGLTKGQIAIAYQDTGFWSGEVW
jgi:hypothetical protein